VKPKIVRTVQALRREVAKWQAEGVSSALVPTMGALHDGHLALVEEGLKLADRAIVSIFVNPKQFAANEDLGRYPRDEDADVEKLAGIGAQLIFVPPVEEIYNEHFATTVSLAGPAKAGLEDKFRPKFFDGVATVVAKLLNQADADFAVFGEKDFQQLQVVRQMARDLDIPTQIVGVPTMREADGMAMSSRNRYLSKVERNLATAIFKNLNQAADKIRGGGSFQAASRAAARSLTTLGFHVDYVSVRESKTMAVPDKTSTEDLRILCAAWLGKTRLIDNIPV
jgi:pantoate--beta-alanine ligase